MPDKPEHIGAILRELRYRKGFSLVTMARAAELSKSAIVRIERGDREPQVATLVGYAKGLDIRFVIDKDGMFIEETP